jgi:DNA replication and repair protein RecF
VTEPVLARLRLRDYRCFGRLDWEPPGPRLLLTGANGTGKTSVLEAIYLAATTKSFRTARLDACLRRGSSAFEVVAEVGQQPVRELAMRWSAEARVRTLDGRTTALADHLAVLPVLAWSQADQELLTGAPELRRRFLDRAAVLLRPALLEDLSRYRRALAAKRALLERGRGAAAELASWNRLLARHGAAIAAARAALSRGLAAALGALVERHLPTLPPIALAYRPATELDGDGEAALAAALDAAAAREAARRSPLVGPHRDDLELSWDGGNARTGASAGERKALGLLLVAATAGRLAEAGREPALLLDDADAELDRERLAAVIGAFSGVARLVATSARPEVWRDGLGLRPVAWTPSGAASGRAS